MNEWRANTHELCHTMCKIKTKTIVKRWLKLVHKDWVKQAGFQFKLDFKALIKASLRAMKEHVLVMTTYTVKYCLQCLMAR